MFDSFDLYELDGELYDEVEMLEDIFYNEDLQDEDVDEG